MTPTEKLIEYKNILILARQDAEKKDLVALSNQMQTKIETVDSCIEILEEK